MALQYGRLHDIKNTSAKAASTAATGAVLTYTAPANTAAIITSYFSDAINASVAASPEVVVAGNTLRPSSTLAAGALTSQPGTSHGINPGESFRWNVTTALATTTADFFISLTEYK